MDRRLRLPMPPVLIAASHCPHRRSGLPSRCRRARRQRHPSERGSAVAAPTLRRCEEGAKLVVSLLQLERHVLVELSILLSSMFLPKITTKPVPWLLGRVLAALFSHFQRYHPQPLYFSCVSCLEVKSLGCQG